MAKPPREQAECSECGWIGVSRRGKARQWVFALSSLAVLVLVVLELVGVIALGDQLWALALTIMLLSIAVRLMIRGDRCARCNTPTQFTKGSRPR